MSLLLFPAALLAQAGPSVSFGATKSRDTVTVGDAFEVRLRVRAPVDATIRFPDNPDTAGTVQARDPRIVDVTDTLQSRDETAIYHVSAWDVGEQPIRLDDIVVTWQGTDRRVPVGGISVFVRSVLPLDSALRVPKPARPLWEIKPFPWWIIAVIAAVAALMAAWWWWRRRRRKGPAIQVIDPYDRAQREFSRIEAMGLVDAGERTRFVALLVEVLRDYLAARYPDATLALTSRELVVLMRRHPTVPMERLSRVLHEADLAKFAAWRLTEDGARTLATESRAIVEAEHLASQPTPASEERAAA